MGLLKTILDHHPSTEWLIFSDLSPLSNSGITKEVRFGGQLLSFINEKYFVSLENEGFLRV
jgi:hypothetical protein